MPEGKCTRLLVIVPATGQTRSHWVSFLAALEREPQSANIEILFFEHGIHTLSLGRAETYARELAACITARLIANSALERVTLIGHSVGGMIVRRAFLNAAQAQSSTQNWASKVDDILLFTSVNRGIPATLRVSLLAPLAGWALRSLPRFGLPIHFVFEDMMLGSDFIADVRIAWIRLFGKLASDGALPQVVQFWGTRDSVVTQDDNADLIAFSGNILVQVPGAQHGNVQRLEPAYTNEPATRWALFRKYLFSRDQQGAWPSAHQPRRVLVIVRGIRDSSYSEWVAGLRTEAEKIYGVGNVLAPEYGFFTAAQFAFKPIRQRNVPSFRDFYAEMLAENPATEFDVIAHSNGTYIVAESLASTPSMRINHLALAAPVLPEDFPWSILIERGQVQRVRYDTAQKDWPVGILCPALRALGFNDVGPAGLVLFGTPETWTHGDAVHNVGWYEGGHGSALTPENRAHLLSFVERGQDLSAAEPLRQEPGAMAVYARLTPYLTWLVIALAIVGVWVLKGHVSPAVSWVSIGASVTATFLIIYVLLDAF